MTFSGSVWRGAVAGLPYGLHASFGGYGERIESPDEIIPAIKRGIEQVESGKPALLEFLTSKELDLSVF